MTEGRSEHGHDILVIDDDPVIGLLAREYLTPEGYQVTVSRDGDSGLEQVEQQRPDLVLLDVRIPGVDGFEVCRQIRNAAWGRHLPIMMLTALDDVGSVERAFREGASDFFSKPINWSLLQHRIAFLLRAVHNLEENRALSRRVIAVQEEERRYLSRELHDELAQNLSAITLFAKHMSDTAREVDPQLIASADEILGLATQMVTTVRSLVDRLRPPLLDQLGLLEALTDMVARWRSRHPDIHCSFTTAGDLDNSSENVSMALYRIVQESLTNIEKHAGASEVRIEMVRSASGVRLKTSDNGRGLDLGKIRLGMGLVGIRERAESLHGTFALQSVPGQGTSIQIGIPLPDCR